MAGPGNALRVDPITRAPSRTGLLAAIEATGGVQVPEIDERTGRPSEKWLNGITYQSGCGGTDPIVAAAVPFGCGVVDGGSNPVETADKAISDMRDSSGISVTYPFLATMFEECTTLGWEDHSYPDRARRFFEECESAIVEHEFWTGAAIQSGTDDYGQTAPDPESWLASGNAQPVTSDAVQPTNAIAALEDGLTGCCGDGGMIHVPYGSVEYLQARGLIVRDRNLLRTVLGNVVVPGKGYPGTDPDGDIPDDGTTWLYATGPVRYWRMSDIAILPTTMAEALVRNDDGVIMNSLRFHAERGYLVDFDRCCHFAAQMNLVDVAPDTT